MCKPYRGPIRPPLISLVKKLISTFVYCLCLSSCCAPRCFVSALLEPSLQSYVPLLWLSCWNWPVRSRWTYLSFHPQGSSSSFCHLETRERKTKNILYSQNLPTTRLQDPTFSGLLQPQIIVRVQIPSLLLKDSFGSQPIPTCTNSYPLFSDGAAPKSVFHPCSVLDQIFNTFNNSSFILFSALHRLCWVV